MSSLNMEEVFKTIFEETGIKGFATYGENEAMMLFADFVNKNREIALEALGRISQNEREGK